MFWVILLTFLFGHLFRKWDWVDRHINWFWNLDLGDFFGSFQLWFGSFNIWVTVNLLVQIKMIKVFFRCLGKSSIHWLFVASKNFFICLLKLVKWEKFIGHDKLFDVTNLGALRLSWMILFERIFNFLYHLFELVGPDWFLVRSDHNLSVKIKVFTENALFLWIKESLVVFPS